MNKYDYPIETELQKKFWSSRHDDNIALSIICFSKVQATEEETKARTIRNLALWNKRSRKWSSYTRLAIYNTFKEFIDTPDFAGIPFHELGQNTSVIDPLSIKDFKATDGVTGAITFTWTEKSTFRQYDLYEFISEGVVSLISLDVNTGETISGSGTGNFFIRAYSIDTGFIDSNMDGGSS